MQYSLGLDIGIASIGWAVLNYDDNRIEDLGVRCFNAAEDPKTKASLALPRRLTRGARRRLRRRAGRLQRAKLLFVEHGLVPEERIDSLYIVTAGEAKDPWELRNLALQQILEPTELARALFHIIKRRGFKSNRKAVKDGSDEDGKVLLSIGENRQIMQEHGYRTAGQMYALDVKFCDRKRNTTDNYTHSVDRPTLEQEITIIFEEQKRLGNALATDDLRDKVLSIFNWQMPYAKGDDIIKMIGYCTFEPEEIRAPVNAYSRERFMLLQKINHMNLTVMGSLMALSPEEKAKLVELAYKRAKVTYTQVRKALELDPEQARFIGVNYSRGRKKDDGEYNPLEGEKDTCFELKGYHAMRKCFDKAGVWDSIKGNPDLLDTLAEALTYYKTDDDIAEYLRGNKVDEPIVLAALQCETFSKAGHMSLKAIRKVLPYLEQGMIYSDACTAAGYNHSSPLDGVPQYKLPVIPEELTNNPVVMRALCQARKVVNAVIERYGSPTYVRIEMARDVGKSKDDRAEIQKRQKENEENKNRAVAYYISQFPEIPESAVKGDELLKMRLYREQNGRCGYSQEIIELYRLRDHGYVEIDHILPFSRSFDNGYNNKVLVLNHENQNKRNRTPREYLEGNPQRWKQFEDWVMTTYTRNRNKRDNMLRKDFSEQKQTEFIERNLTDTKYIARAFSQFLRQNLKFADPTVKVPVRSMNGRITSMMRGLWGLEKIRSENDLHHAMDACVIAATEQRMVQILTR